MAVFTTGEAVPVDLPVARIPTRAAAFVIDVVVQLTVGLLLTIALSVVVIWARVDPAWREVTLVVLLVALLAGYPITCETLLRGRTLGKLALGLRVLRTDGGPVGFRHVVTRGLAGAIVDFWALGGFGIIAVVTSLCSPRARRVGDVLAGTLVVHDRVRIPLSPLVIAPPWMAGWARQLDLSGLTEDLALSVRQYLGRFRTLTPDVRNTLGHELVAAVCAQLRISPPNGYPPLHILAAVLAERQRRDLVFGESPSDRWARAV